MGKRDRRSELQKKADEMASARRAVSLGKAGLAAMQRGTAKRKARLKREGK